MDTISTKIYNNQSFNAFVPDEDAILLISKPITWTSFDVIRYLKKNLHIKKLGHAGTLDPLATGLIIVCTGKMTKKIVFFQSLQKEYETTFCFGKETISYDAEFDPIAYSNYKHITIDDINNCIKTYFQGEIEQTPPSYSAIKINGQRAYKKARKGQLVSMPPRRIYINNISILDWNPPYLKLSITCSKGTYIRSIAHDMGKKMKSLAYVHQLCRTSIGKYHLRDAISIPIDYSKYDALSKSLYATEYSS